MRLVHAAPLLLIAGLAGSPAFAQSSITCDTIAAAASLTEAQQRALGTEAAAQVSDISASDPAAADVLQACIANGPAFVLAGFQVNAPSATGDLAVEGDVDTENQGDVVDTGTGLPASSS